MAPINSLSGLRKRYENDPARLAAINAGEREGIAAAGNPSGGPRAGHMSAFRAYSPSEAIRRQDAELDADFRRRTANMGRNPALETNARRAALGTYGKNTVGVTLSRDNGSNNSMREAAAYAAAHPGLRTGSDVFGRNDREAAMQRNRDFIRSSRSSMFGPRPATTKGQNAEALRGLKRYEAETARRTNAAAAQNHRYELEQLAGLRGRELDITARNNAAMAGNDRLKSLLKFRAAIANAQRTESPNAATSRVLEMNDADSAPVTRDADRLPTAQPEPELEPLPPGGLEDRREAYRQRGITWSGEPYMLGDGGEPLRTSPTQQLPVTPTARAETPAPVPQPAPETPVPPPPVQEQQGSPLPPTLPETGGEGLRRTPAIQSQAQPAAAPAQSAQANARVAALRKKYPRIPDSYWEESQALQSFQGLTPDNIKPVMMDGRIVAMQIDMQQPGNGAWRELTPKELKYYGFGENYPKRIRDAQAKARKPGPLDNIHL